MLMHRRALLGAVPLALAAPRLGRAAMALDRPAKIIIGFPAGGASDIAARLLAEKMGGVYAPQVVVDNRAGAAGRLAIEAVKAAAPDGTTILLSPETMFEIYPHIYKRTLRYTFDDFALVTAATEFGFGIIVHGDNPAQNFEAFVAWAKQQPEPIPYASPAAGSTPHFTMEMAAKAFGFRVQHVAYRGMGPAYPDIISGRLVAGISVFGDLVEQAKGGKMRILANTSPMRSPKAPAVPTLKELGQPQLTATEQFLIMLPKGTPGPIVAACHDSMLHALRDPSVREALDRLEQAPVGNTAADVHRRLVSERDRWGPIVTATGYTVEE